MRREGAGETLMVPPQSCVLLPGQGTLQRPRSASALVSGSRSPAQKHSLEVKEVSEGLIHRLCSYKEANELESYGSYLPRTPAYLPGLHSITHFSSVISAAESLSENVWNPVAEP